LLNILAHVGIALATSLAAWLNAGVLLILLLKRGHYTPDKRLQRRGLGIIAASAVMAGGLWIALPHVSPLIEQGMFERILGLALLVGGGGLLYGVCVLLFGAAHLQDLKSMLRRRKSA